MRFISFFILIISIYSCQKDSPGFNASTFEDEVLVINGELTDLNEIQTINLSYATTINSDEERPCTTGEVELVGLSDTYTFYHFSNGDYYSEMPFSMTPGGSYTLNAINNEKESSGHIKMSTPYLIDSGYNYSYYSIYLSITSAIGQYIFYDCYTADTSLLDMDTNWTKLNLTSSTLERTNVGSQEIYLDALSSEYSSLTSYPLLKIITYSMSAEAGDYLRQLDQFTLQNATNNGYKNPPAYFTNDTYGLVYGTIKDSVIFRLSE